MEPAFACAGPRLRWRPITNAEPTITATAPRMIAQLAYVNRSVIRFQARSVSRSELSGRERVLSGRRAGVWIGPAAAGCAGPVADFVSAGGVSAGAAGLARFLNHHLGVLSAPDLSCRSFAE